MSYQALYRVWRPQQLKDVVGQEHITKTLQNALESNKFSHAYLFTGPRGTGKTSAAKIISKAINCEHAPVKEPCNECRFCKGITDGSIVDVIEIDAASNNGVDEIRDIRDKVKFAPNEVRYKVYIIDEVHMLSTGAFNALLKTLEEPPKHVIFILATTEPHKIPLTIISRCQRFDFKRISSQALVERLKFILSHYEVKVEDEGLQLLSRAADGGMRDALSLLDQAISYSSGVVTLEDVLSITGAVSQQFLTDVVTAIYKGETANALKAVNQLINDGKDPKRFIEDLIYYFRDILLYQTAPSLTEMLERATVDDGFLDLANNIPRAALYSMIETLNQSQQEMKWSNHTKIFLEIVIVKLTQEKGSDHSNQSSSDTVEQLLRKVQQLESSLVDLKKGGVSTQPTEEKVENKRTPRKPKVATSLATVGPVKEMLQSATKQHLQIVTSKWGQVMERTRQQNIRAHAWLSDSKPVAASSNAFILAFQNEMHRDMIDTKFKEEIEAVASEMYGQPFRILSILSVQWDKLKEEFIREQRGETTEQEVDPLVEEGIKLVGADLVEIIET